MLSVNKEKLILFRRKDKGGLAVMRNILTFGTMKTDETTSKQDSTPDNIDALLALAEANQRAARRLIEQLDVEGAFRRIGAEAHLVGSLRTGLLMTHLDVDFHIYSPSVSVRDSFAAVAEIAARPGVCNAWFTNSLDTDEQCLEWHLHAADHEGRTWQVDLIHMPSDSPFAGFFERVADRIAARLTPETRLAVLAMKAATPGDTKIAGVEYYRAVLDGGVRTWDDFMAWRRAHPLDGVDTWMP